MPRKIGSSDFTLFFFLFQEYIVTGMLVTSLNLSLYLPWFYFSFCKHHFVCLSGPRAVSSKYFMASISSSCQLEYGKCVGYVLNPLFSLLSFLHQIICSPSCIKFMSRYRCKAPITEPDLNRYHIHIW